MVFPACIDCSLSFVLFMFEQTLPQQVCLSAVHDRETEPAGVHVRV